MMKRLRRFFSEWAANRAGRQPIDQGPMRRASRDIIGPTGYMLTRSVDVLGESGDAYLKSFEDHMPPSLFVSKRDRTRLNQAIPLPERAIPDIVAGTADPDLEGYEEAFRQMDREAVERLIDAAGGPDPSSDDDSVTT